MKRRTFQKGEWLGESVGFYKASPVFLSVVLETSAPALSEQLVNAVNADLQVPPEDSDSVGPEWDQRICILIQPQVIPRHPKFENHCNTLSQHSPCKHSYIFNHLFKYVYLISTVCQDLF